MEGKPTVFIGSSTEGLEIARAIQVQLEEVASSETWKDGVFGLTCSILESLVQALPRFDFGVFVLTPDDLVESRGVERKAARDNVLIELGLFIGHLGRERTYLVHAKDDEIRVPSDLRGMTFATYSTPDPNGSVLAAVAGACTHIRQAMRNAPPKKAALHEVQQAMASQEKRSDDQARRLAEQQSFINDMVKYAMSASVFNHLCGIALLHEYIYHDYDGMRRELYFLRDAGFIKPRHSGFLDFGPGQHEHNLASIAEPTPVGWMCVRLRRSEIPSQMLQDTRNLRIDPAKLQ
jgi:hypothetical protein